MAEQSASFVQVVYALPARQRIVEVAFTEGITAREALSASGLMSEHPEIGERPLVLGLFGREIAPSQSLRPGDRVEICRPLAEDPRTMRRQVLGAGRVMGQRSGSR